VADARVEAVPAPPLLVGLLHAKKSTESKRSPSRRRIATSIAVAPARRAGDTVPMEETTRTRSKLKLTASGAADIGQIRVHNEDAVLLRPDLHLYILADGAGGHNAGNVASAVATTSIANYFEATQIAYSKKPEVDDFGLATGARRIAAALQHANHDIVEIAKTSNKYRGMGTTAVAVCANPETGALHLAHVGDSRCYRLRAGQLEQLTIDHSLINEVLELRPDIDDEKIAQLPRHVVTRALGMAESVRVSARSLVILPGDKYLLCSDGLTDMLDDETLQMELEKPKPPDVIGKELIEDANFAGGEDNIAVIVLTCEDAGGQPAATIVRRPLRDRVRTQPVITPPQMRGTFGSAPEIIVLGTESIAEIDVGAMHIVPAESASPTLRDAFAGLARKRAPGDPPSR
jgi:protein phosphatase